jgi:ribosomal protein S6--L-glutamate ligase
MILSFHPILPGDVNRLCAGREPNAEDAVLIKKADAVLLPQGCGKSLYQTVRKHCKNVFPNYDYRFQYPGKIDQIQLFKDFRIPHPKSMCFKDVESFKSYHGTMGSFPMVLKFDWGGEGETVFCVKSKNMLDTLIDKAALFESTGQRGFLLQEFISTGGRTLRVVALGSRYLPYWRVCASPDGFYGNLASGGYVDRDSDPDFQYRAVDEVSAFCSRTGINLAGFDIVFSVCENIGNPYFLEINYFFGREGLGGSDRYYKMLQHESNLWLKELGLKRREENRR